MVRDNDRDRRDNRDRDRRDRDREKERDRRRDRSRSPRDRNESSGRREKDRDRNEKRDKDRDRKKESSSKKDKKEDLDLGQIVNDKELLEQRLSLEMQKRREKAEKWRQSRKQLDGEQNEATEAPVENNEPKKTWTLDDDGDFDETDNTEETVTEELETTEKAPEDMEIDKKEENGTTKEQDEEIDPLDAFMSELNKEASAKKSEAAGKARVVVIKTQKHEAKTKGDIVENEDDNDYVVDDFDMEQAASSLLAKGRMLAQTDHGKVYYRPFRKNFYIEIPEIAKMTKKEVEEYREELDGVRVRGKKCPKPIKTWAQCGVEFVVSQALKKYNYIKPTPIQAQAIPAIMSGRDVIGIAKTGSGKTLGKTILFSNESFLAFLLPMFRHIMDQSPLEEMDGPIALIMAPTRELALQTWKEANKFAKSLDIQVVCVYGGVGISEQIADLKKGAEVIVCTPGRMIDMLAANNGKVTNLRRVTYLVLDEADRMFDMGFEPQVMKIINNIRPDRQTVLFSATFPKQMEALARKALEQPIEIQVGGKSVVCKDVEQHAMIVEEHVKFLKLLELLGQYWEYGNVLVFVDKQEKADDLVTDLMKAGYNCAPLHGGIDQFDRDSTIIDFKAGKLKLMVATSVAARGLDVKKLILVVNYDCPNHFEDYVHRVGRTGRAGNKGYAYTFILPEGQEKMAGEVCRAFESADCEPPEELKQLWVSYKKKMKEQGVEIHTGGGGFSGHGFKYDATENESEMTKRKFELLVHSEDQNDEEIEEQFTSMMKSRQRVSYRQRSEIAKAGKAAAGSGDRIAAARAAAEKIAAEKQLNAQPIVEKDAASLTAEAIMKGTEAAPVSQTASSIAKQKAEDLNARLNYLPSERVPFGDQEQQLQYFEEELEINDFPQQIRYKVCSRESIAQVQEFADVGISVRGTHYPRGKEPKDGMDRKLYLFLESRDEISLRRGKEEIVRIMRDAFKQLTAQGRQPTGGRYKVF